MLTMPSLARTQVKRQSARVYSPPHRKGPPDSSSFLSRVSRAELRGTCYVVGRIRSDDLQGARNLWGQRFSAYFILKVAPQRGEGEKREGVQISKNSTQNL